MRTSVVLEIGSLRNLRVGELVVERADNKGTQITGSQLLCSG